MDFHGQHIVVTGGSSGIGLVTAQLLASRGARVSLIARRKELLDEAVAGIGEHAAGSTPPSPRPRRTSGRSTACSPTPG